MYPVLNRDTFYSADKGQPGNSSASNNRTFKSIHAKMSSQPQPGKWDSILPIYNDFFHYAGLFGIFPYNFDPKNLKLTAMNKGLSFYWYLLNVLYLSTNLSKSAVIFLLNWFTNFEFEDIQGGYFFQLLWLAGPSAVGSMTYGFSHSRKEFAAALTACIKLEKQIITGKLEFFLKLKFSNTNFNILFKKTGHFGQNL